MSSFALPETQTVLLLHAPKEQYQVTENYAVPSLEKDDEVLVRTEFIGLNPVDWKSPDYGFAIPVLPYIAGRELAGTVVKTSGGSTRLNPGQKVIVIATDYRDLRKAAFQQYAVARDFNVVKIPWHLPVQHGATIGVVFVAAALALGVCMGLDFSSVCDGPNLLETVRSLDPELLPKDVRQECLEGISKEDRAKPGDWLAIWGGSSNSANITLQLARLAGLRVVTIVDAAKHGGRLLNDETLRPDALVDGHDPLRAAEVVRSVTGGQLRFGLDTGSPESATSLLAALKGSTSKAQDGRPLSPPGTPRGHSAHLIGMSGLPPPTEGSEIMLHTVPIKLFHEVPEIGQQLSIWLEKLLHHKLLETPRILDVEEGLESVNKGLDRMRRYEISGGKLVVKVT